MSRRRHPYWRELKFEEFPPVYQEDLPGIDGPIPRPTNVYFLEGLPANVKTHITYNETRNYPYSYQIQRIRPYDGGSSGPANTFEEAQAAVARVLVRDKFLTETETAGIFQPPVANQMQLI